MLIHSNSFLGIGTFESIEPRADSERWNKDKIQSPLGHNEH